MIKQIEILKKTRQYLLGLISELTIEQLNEIPEGYNNNIIWNVAHLIASQQGVCYLRGGLPLFVKEELFVAYKPDTKPQGIVNAEQIGDIKKLLLSSIDRMQVDYENKLFANNPAWTNRYGVEHSNIDDTINFLLFHDGLHLGYIMALKRIVKK